MWRVSNGIARHKGRTALRANLLSVQATNWTPFDSKNPVIGTKTVEDERTALC